MTVRLNQPIPVLRPWLPSLDQLIPYLRRIDETRLYSNHGPLWIEFRTRMEQRLSSQTGGREVYFIPVSSGTTAIEACLKTRALPGRRLCLMPSYTFIASAHAVCNAGLEPFLLDIDEESLALTPAIVEQALAALPEEPAAVLVVSAFGAPPDVASWTDFEERHGIPVVFDAAAALAALTSIGSQPLAVSLHATKVLGIGEGGAVITTSRALADQIAGLVNFGFAGAERLSAMRGGNYRISEYSAAIGLASLDHLDAKIARLKDIAGQYTHAFAGRAAMLQPGAGTEWPTMTLNVTVPAEAVGSVVARLDADAIQWRRWWGLGTHRHPAFASLARADLDRTDRMAPRIIGVPVFEEINARQIALIAEAFP